MELIQAIKVHLHCLLVFHTNFKGEDHRVCVEETQYKINDHVVRGETFHFCTCGYNDTRVTNE